MSETLSPPVSFTPGALRLHDWGLILAQGPDAASFLHGQLTQDVNGLRPDTARPAGYCSAKGRLLASFVIWRAAPETVALACSADVLAPTLKRLSMFVLRAKCKLSDASASWALWGLAGAEAGAWLGAEAASAPAWRTGEHEGSRWIRLPDADGVPRWLLARPAEQAEQAAPPLPALSADTWAWLEVRSAVPRVVAATVEHFVPQMVNLELVGGVNFQKGCYPGQEVVARSQYRGTLKRRMVPMTAPVALVPGQEIVHTSDPGQPAGEVVLAAPSPAGGWSALVEVKLAMLPTPGHFAADGQRLEVSALPYALPAEAA